MSVHSIETGWTEKDPARKVLRKTRYKYIHVSKYNIWTDGDPDRKILNETKYTHHPNTIFGRKGSNPEYCGLEMKIHRKGYCSPTSKLCELCGKKKLRHPSSTNFCLTHKKSHTCVRRMNMTQTKPKKVMGPIHNIQDVGTIEKGLKSHPPATFHFQI